MKFAFFGTPVIACIVLDELAKKNIVPSLIITNPDALVGRKQILTPPPAKDWAAKRNIPIIQPLTLKDRSLLPELTESDWDVFVVVAYGKIIPQWLLDIPKSGTVNVHPSLLPKLRGASPIRSAILENESHTGVSIMLLDALMDHGPLLAQVETPTEKEAWPMKGSELDVTMATEGGRLLAEVLPAYLAGVIIPQPQDHAKATFCTKITKDMSELIIDPQILPTGIQAHTYLRQVRAFDGWPETFFIHDGKRIKIKDAEIRNDTFYPLRIVPEGKKEMAWSNYFK